MRLQARSMSRYVSPDLLDEIIVIENTPPAMADRWRDQMREEYNALAHLVRFLPASAIVSMPQGIAGWFSQQALKLKVAEVVRSDRFLILDAKNHFVFPFGRENIERNGKPRIYTHGYTKHPLRRYLEPILRYFGLPVDEHVQRFLPTTPPFVMDTNIVCEMIQHLSLREGKRFEEAFFRSPTTFTEFFLYGAYLLATDRSFDDMYDMSSGGSPVIWKEIAADDARVTADIASAERRSWPLFSVHRASFPLLTETGRKLVAEFWVRRKLFPSMAEALAYLDAPNRR